MQIYLVKVYVLLVQMLGVTRFLRSVIVSEEGGAKSFSQCYLPAMLQMLQVTF